MDDKTYTITLADGTEIGGLSLNGNNFISSEAIDETIFEDNCSPIIINNGETDEVHEHMALVQTNKVNDKYWFILRDVSQKEIADAQFRSDLEYVAMMCGIEL